MIIIMAWKSTHTLLLVFEDGYR